ncbi:MAG: DUF1800 domain-containing protein, partial [Chloroflexi bacterium]|nr:DUF1800 domain-containing protein [Chloroflexota bacterium]
CDARLSAAGFTTLGKPLLQLWADHVVNNSDDWYYRVLPFIETEKATLIRAVYSQRQLFEVLADFWHNHFNVYGWHYYVAPIFVHYDRDVIRANLLGNFRVMLGEMARSTAMLFYLDNYINQAGGFNENFARELLELHTLGAENYLGVMNPFDVPVGDDGVAVGYVDNDVYEAARCFTGWRVDYSSWEPGVGESGAFLYYPAWHDRANKFFMRRYFPADQADMQDGEDVLDMLARHPGTARFIAGKLCRRLIGDNPPQDVIDAAAAVFLANTAAADQLKQVTRAILLHPSFSATWGDKIKRPFEAAASMLRAMDADFSPSDDFGWAFENAGQPLFGRIPPDGYPDHKSAWIGATSLLQRWRLCSMILEGWLEGVSANPVSQMPASLRTPNAIADWWISRLLGRAMHPAENRQEVVDFIAQGRNPDFDLPLDMIADALPSMVGLILMSPDFQLR